MLRLGSVVLVLAFCSGQAWAWTGTVVWPTYYRAGPGNQYGVLDEVERGQTFEVLSCDGAWCRVQDGRSVGYLQRTALGSQSAQAVAPGKPGACFTSRGDEEPGEFETFRYCQSTGAEATFNR